MLKDIIYVHTDKSYLSEHTANLFKEITEQEKITVVST